MRRNRHSLLPSSQTIQLTAAKQPLSADASLFKQSKLFGLKAVFIVTSFCLVACGNKDDVYRYVESVKSTGPGKIESVPQIKPYLPFAYSAANMRDPFQPFNSAITKGHPNTQRPKEVLEGFPLDALHVVGLLVVSDNTWAVISMPNGAVQRAKVGNYIGQNFGQITDINNNGVKVVESIPTDSGWIKRTVTLTLTETPTGGNSDGSSAAPSKK